MRTSNLTHPKIFPLDAFVLDDWEGGGGGHCSISSDKQNDRKVWVQFPARAKTFRFWKPSRVAQGKVEPQWIADPRSFVVYWPDYAADNLSPFSVEVWKAWNCTFISHPSWRRGIRGSDGFAVTHAQSRDLVRCGGRNCRKGYERSRPSLWIKGIKVNDKTFRNLYNTLYLAYVVCFSSIELNAMSKHGNTLQKFSQKISMILKLNSTELVYVISVLWDAEMFTFYSGFLLTRWREAKRRQVKSDVEVAARRALCTANAFMPYEAIHSSSVQLTSTALYTQPLYVLFALIYPAANNTSSNSSFCLEMFLNRILKSAIMKHYVLVSIPITNPRTLFELRKEVGVKANEGQC